MKFVDEHMKNVALGAVAFVATYWLFKFIEITIDAGFWLLYILLIFIYFELWSISKKK